MASKKTVLELPPGWALSNLTVHYEGEDLREDPHPFAANIVAQLRFDLGPDADLEEVVEADLENARLGSDKFELVAKTIKPDRAEVEWTSGSGRDALRQMAVYRNVAGSIYSIVGTHREDRFGAVRKDIMSIVGRLLERA